MSARSKLAQAMAFAGVGAAAAHLLDPDRGRARRARLRDQALARSRRATEKLETEARYRQGQIEGLRARSHGQGHLHPTDEHVVKQAVEQRLSATGVDTTDVVVDVTDGVVGLRGKVQHPDEVRRLGKEAAGVPGVNEVRSWLHLPGQPAPNKADSLGART